MTAGPFVEADEIGKLDDAYCTLSTCSLQWRAFLASLAIELHLGSESEEVRTFLRAVGSRLASRLPLPKVETLEELETAMNRVWLEVNWGWVRLGADDEGIWIVHGSYPTVMVEDDPDLWSLGCSAVLEGVYSHWLTAQGSPGVKTRRVSRRARPLEFRHGV